MAIFFEYLSQSLFAFRHSAFSCHFEGSKEEWSFKNAICSAGVFISLSFFIYKFCKTIIIYDIVVNKILAYFFHLNKFIKRMFPFLHRPGQLNCNTGNNIYAWIQLYCINS